MLLKFLPGSHPVRLWVNGGWKQPVAESLKSRQTQIWIVDGEVVLEKKYHQIVLSRTEQVEDISQRLGFGFKPGWGSSFSGSPPPEKKIVPNNEIFYVDGDSDDYGDPVDDVDAVHGDNVDFADLDNKVDVGDVGRPRHQVQGAPHVSELEAGPLSLSTLGKFSFNIILLLL